MTRQTGSADGCNVRGAVVTDDGVENTAWSLGLYRRALWGSMDRLGVRDSVERKVMAAVVLQYLSMFALLLVPVAFHGPVRTLELFSTPELLVIGTIVVLATVAFVNTVWIVRRDLLDPIIEMQAVATALTEGRLDESPSVPTEDDEVGRLQEALASVHRYLQVVNAQAHALRREAFDATVLEKSIPGPLGASLDTMQVELTRQIRERDRELEANERTLRRFHRVSSDTERNFEEKVDALLELGCDRLGTDYGYVARADVEAGVEEVVAGTGDHERLQPGETLALDRSYCRHAIGSDGPTSFERPEEWADDPAHDILGFGSYIGQEVVVAGERYGTVCFGDPEPGSISEFEETFVDLVALWIGHELGRERRIRNLRVLFDQSPDGLVVHDASGAVSQVNDRLVEWLGYDREDILEMNVADFDDDHAPDELSDRLASMASGEVRKFESVHRQADGSTYPVEVWTNRIETVEAGSDDEFLAVFRDVTERHDRLRQLRVLDRVLRHNLHNEMAVIRGYAETIETMTPPEAQDHVATIVRASNRLMKTVDKERDIVELLGEQPDYTEHDAAAVVERLADARERDHPGIRVETACPDSAPVRAIPQFDQAIDELIENAASHNDRDPGTVTVTVEPDGDRTWIEVRDDGPGIPEAEVAVLEDNAIEPLYHGSGLGLWLVHWVVKLSNGSVEFRENEPRGSVVTIEVPRAE